VQPNKFENTHVTYIPKKKPIRNKSDKFSQQNITFDDTPLFFPAGMEKFFLLLYFILLPYIAGLLFLFFYVGKGKVDLFLSLNEDASFMLTWAVGYEIIAVLILLWVVKSAISFTMSNAKKGKNRQFRRP